MVSPKKFFGHMQDLLDAVRDIAQQLAKHIPDKNSTLPGNAADGDDDADYFDNSLMKGKLRSWQKRK